MDADAEIDSRALGRAPRVQSKRERRDYMCKAVKTMMDIATVTADSN